MDRLLSVGLISLFPDVFNALNYGIVGRAVHQQLVSVQTWNPRDYTRDKHKTVDDRVYGGGPGMVMMAEPLIAAIQAAKTALGTHTDCVYLSPQGQTINQQVINNFVASKRNIILIAGRYEGIDERVIENHVDYEWSLGDFVMSGGEFAALAAIDAMVRLLPGALGDKESAERDSFMQGLLDYPHYTRPEQVDGLKVPPVLLSGNHQAIEKWRLKQSLGKTWLKRPDLLENRSLSEIETTLLTEFKNELN